MPDEIALEQVAAGAAGAAAHARDLAGVLGRGGQGGGREGGGEGEGQDGFHGDGSGLGRSACKTRATMARNR